MINPAEIILVAGLLAFALVYDVAALRGVNQALKEIERLEAELQRLMEDENDG